MSTFISEQTLIKRINQALKHEKRQLKKTKTNVVGPEYSDLGDYYIVDSRFHFIEPKLDLEKLGRFEGVLKDGERCSY